jgi:transketolase
VADLQWESIDEKAVNTVRVLAADAVQKVGNGHPGTAMSLAPAAYLLFQKVMRRDPSDSTWIGRDRFILSVGHSSLTQYIQFYLGGYGLELEDLEQLRTWGSKTPGHPEYGHTDGIEITTGPLGQGLASSVGFAYASRFERGLFDPEAPAGTSPFDHFVYVIAGDGDMQEGVTSEAATSSSATSSRSTTRTRSRSRTTPTSPSRRTSTSASRPTTGMSRSSTGRRPASTSKTCRNSSTPSSAPRA